MDLEGKLEEKNQLVLRLEEDLLAADTKDASTESNLKKQPSDTSFYLKEGRYEGPTLIVPSLSHSTFLSETSIV